MAVMLLLRYTVALRRVFMLMVVFLVGSAIAVTQVEVDLVVVLFFAAIALVHIRVLAVLVIVLLVRFFRRLVAVIGRGRLRGHRLLGCCLGLRRRLVVVVAGSC